MTTVVVAVVVSPTHGGNGHAEGLHVFSFKLEHVFASFEVVHRNHGV